jgi:hypothetical protein
MRSHDAGRTRSTPVISTGAEASETARAALELDIGVVRAVAAGCRSSRALRRRHSRGWRACPVSESRRLELDHAERQPGADRQVAGSRGRRVLGALDDTRRDDDGRLPRCGSRCACPRRTQRVQLDACLAEAALVVEDAQPEHVGGERARVEVVAVPGDAQPAERLERSADALRRHGGDGGAQQRPPERGRRLEVDAEDLDGLAGRARWAAAAGSGGSSSAAAHSAAMARSESGAAIASRALLLGSLSTRPGTSTAGSGTPMGRDSRCPPRSRRRAPR